MKSRTKSAHKSPYIMSTISYKTVRIYRKRSCIYSSSPEGKVHSKSLTKKNHLKHKWKSSTIVEESLEKRWKLLIKKIISFEKFNFSLEIKIMSHDLASHLPLVLTLWCLYANKIKGKYSNVNLLVASNRIEKFFITVKSGDAWKYFASIVFVINFWR